jgi:hypothetical protein
MAFAVPDKRVRFSNGQLAFVLWSEWLKTSWLILNT